MDVRLRRQTQVSAADALKASSPATAWSSRTPAASRSTWSIASSPRRRARHVEIIHIVAIGKGEYAGPVRRSSTTTLFVGAGSREAVNEAAATTRRSSSTRSPSSSSRATYARRRARPGLAAGQARLLQLRHLGGLHQAGRPGRQARHRPGEPAHAAHARRRVRPRLATSTTSSRARPTSSSCAAKIGPVEEAIGRHIASLVDDGTCLQLGIGGIPDAVLPSCTRRTTSACTGRCSATASSTSTTSGVLTNGAKSYHRGKIVGQLPHGHAPPLRLRRRQSADRDAPGRAHQRPRDHRPERRRRRHQLGHPGRPHRPGRRRPHGRSQFTRHRRAGGLRARRGPQPGRQADHRPAVHRQAPARVSRIVAADHARHGASPPCAPTSTTSSPSTAIATCAGRAPASAPAPSSRSPTGVPRPDHRSRPPRFLRARPPAPPPLTKDTPQPSTTCTTSPNCASLVRQRPPARAASRRAHEAHPTASPDPHHRRRRRRPARHQGAEAQRHQGLRRHRPGRELSAVCASTSSARGRGRPYSRRLRQVRARAADEHHRGDRAHRRAGRLRSGRRLRRRLAIDFARPSPCCRAPANRTTTSASTRSEDRPAHDRHPDHGRHGLRVHCDRHLRQREAQREAGPREPLPHAERGPHRPRAHAQLPAQRHRRLGHGCAHPQHRGLHLGERDDAHRLAGLRGHQAHQSEHPHRRLRREQHVGARRHGRRAP